ncbi:MAG: hypothetical protein IT391_07110 [Nitrospira sp.]|nr:hypothetical protein [Nitrospira sp.]
MSIQYVIQRKRNGIANFLLAIGVALAWMSVTPAGALSCLHCFLSQRWVEATVVEPGPRQSRPETQTDLSAHASRLVALDPRLLSDSAVGDPHQSTVTDASSPGDAPTAIVWQWVCRTHSVPAPLMLDAGSSQSLATLDPTILGFRAPPSLITT